MKTYTQEQMQEIKDFWSTKCLEEEHKVEIWKAENKRLKEMLEEILNISSSWPLASIVTKLDKASKILLRDKDYDGHGYEQIHYASLEAKKWLVKEMEIRKELWELCQKKK